MRFVLFAILLLCVSFMQAQKTLPEKNSVSPAGTSKARVIQRPLNVNPQSESQFSAPTGGVNRDKEIEKPQPQPRSYAPSLVGKAGVDDKIEDPWTQLPPKRKPRKWYRKISGFRVFLDQGATIGFGKDYNHRIDWFGSFGYQFNPIYFLGVGQGYSISLNNKESTGPTFLNTRVNFLDENTTPYMDLKLGYSFIEGKGIFVNPTFGMSFGKKRRAWNIGVGYSFQKADFWRKGVKTKHNYHGVSLRVTYEFGIF